MRVLVVSTNREQSPQTLVPLGACCVASAAEAAGHEVELLDLCFERQPIQAMADAARRVRPDVVGLSVRNLDNCDFGAPRSYLPELAEIVSACRGECGARTVLGGPAASQAPAELLHITGADFAVVGEGECAFPELMRALEDSGDPASVPGVVTRDGRMSPSVPLDARALADTPDPEPWKWLDLRRYGAFDAALPVQTKRGCALKCIHCSYPLLEGSEWRPREPEWVADQVERAAMTPLRGVEFVDSVFGLPGEHALECCEAVSRRTGGRVPLCTLDLNPMACSMELVEAMNAAGFSAVGITAESGSDAMLAILGKGFTCYDLRVAALRLGELDAAKLWMFMLGGPGETEATVSETARFIDHLPRGSLVLVTCGIRVLPRTRLARQLIAEGELNAEADLSQPVFYHSPHISPERSLDIIAQCDIPPGSIVTLTDGGHRLAPLVQRTASILRVRPPYWRYLPAINRARRFLGV